MTLDRLTDEVLRRLQERLPRTLLVGQAPAWADRWNLVEEAPFTQVFIGILPPGELLRMPSDPVCRALLDGLPVYLCSQPCKKGSGAGALRRELAAAEERLYRFGARPAPQPGGLLTAQTLAQWNAPLPERCRPTPLARDILEERKP